MLKIFNTLGKKLEEFKPLEEGKIKFYQCGPTVYWTQHIGNMRAMVMADLVLRTLKYLGYEVSFVRNYTDFGHLTSDADSGEDKMEKGAKREGKTPQEIADKYIAEFEKDIKLLNTVDPTVRARATDYIDEMIKMVSELVEKGFAYVKPKAIYFDISKFPKYTELSGQILSKNKEGAGFGDVEDSDKLNPEDFAVWFFRTGVHKNALQRWPSPFTSPEVENGEGFPGWHIECSAMIRKNLGLTIDLHMGGIEHIPVHHTNEIAQSESANGVKFVDYWIHNEHITIDGEKMSKSIGNVLVLEDIIKKGYDPMHLRYLFLQAHYRSKQNFTWEALDASKAAYERLVNILKSYGEESGIIDESYKNKFVNAIENDFNIPEALAVVWEITKSEHNNADKLATILDFDKVLGLELEEKLSVKNEKLISEDAQKLINERIKARAEKNWAKADELRDILRDRFGIEVMDQSL